MSDTPFAQAQARIAARRQACAAEAAAQDAAARSASVLRARIASSAQSAPLVRRLADMPGVAALAAAWDAVAGREGTRPAFRVGQVDAELLDEELLELLRGQVGEALRYFRNGALADEWRAEVLLALRAVLFKLTVWDHDATYGAALQNLRYTDARRGGPVLVPPSRWQKALYGLFTVGGKYGWSKWENWLLGQDDGFDRLSPSVRRLSSITSAFSTVHAAAAFASFLVFLLHGRYRTLLDRILRMRLAPPTSQVSREVSFEYLNRQLVWHAFTEFLLFVLPLVGINRWRRWLARAWRKTKEIINTRADGDGGEKKGEYAFLPERTCAICYQDQNAAATTENEALAAAAAASGVVGSSQTDVTNPYETIPCGCVYCFVCLATRIEREEGEGWACLRCGQLVKECRPWDGDVLQEPASSSSPKKTVVFAEVVETSYDDDARSSGVLIGRHEGGKERIAELPNEPGAKSFSDVSGSDSDVYEAEENELGENLHG